MTTATHHFELFVVEGSTKAQRAEQNLRELCDAALGGRYELRIIDVLENGEAAEAANIVATPALIRRAPPPVRIIVGDLSDRAALADGLGLEVITADSQGKFTDE